MRTGRPKAELILSDEERQELESLAKCRRSASALAQRPRMVLACAAGQDNKTVARRVRVAPATVGKWRRRFLDDRVAGLMDEPRPGAPRQIMDKQIEDVIVRTLESTPKGATHWSTRDMAKATGLSHMTISRIWRAFGLKPHRAETFKLSPDPLLIDKVRDIVGLYLNPPDHAVVFCVLNVTSGEVTGRTFSRQRARELRAFLNELDGNVPEELEVHIILDNASAHKSALIRSWLARHPRFHFHYTPTYSSWMNLVERWFSALTTKQLRRGVHRSVRELVAAIREFIDVHNETGKPYVWVKTADEILASIARFAQRTLKAHGA